MSAAARAEARRKAILSRGTDRLSKLTTTARGDDAPQFAQSGEPHASVDFSSYLLKRDLVDPPAPSAPQGNLSNFLGEDPLPAPITSDPPSRRAPNPRIPPSNTTPSLGGSKSNSPPDPSALSSEQQQQILQALLGGSTPPRTFDINAQATGGAAPDDPLLALLSSMGIQGGIGQGANVTPQSRTEPKTKTAVQKLFPLLHVIAVWALLAYFIFWQEPEAFQARNSVVISSGNIWNRWAKLASGTAAQSTWGVETVVSPRPVATANSPVDMHRSHFSGHSFP